MRHAVDPEATVKLLRDAGRQRGPGFVGVRHLSHLSLLRSRRSARTTPAPATAATVLRWLRGRDASEQRLDRSAHFLLHHVTDHRQQALLSRHRLLLSGGRYTNAHAQDRAAAISWASFRRIMLGVRRRQLHAFRQIAARRLSHHLLHRASPRPPPTTWATHRVIGGGPRDDDEHEQYHDDDGHRFDQDEHHDVHDEQHRLHYNRSTPPPSRPRARSTPLRRDGRYLLNSMGCPQALPPAL
jgi:hypothetical protein